MRYWLAFMIMITTTLASAAEKKPLVSPMMDEMPSMHLLQVFLVLAFVIGVIFLLAYLYQKVSGLALQKNPDLKVITGLSLGTRERVVVIEVGKQQLLVGITQGAMRTLHVLDEPIETKENSTSGFAEHLKTMMQRGTAE